MSVARFLNVILAASLALGLSACSDPSPSKPAVDHGRYYRMKVGLTYKGQPVDIDFVAGCGVHIGHDASGGSIHEIAGMTDLFRGVRMPEGHAVVINSYPWFESPRFNPCDGDTTNDSKFQADKVPKDWLPFIVWFERDDQFAHGVCYMTQDAYDNKNAHFGFRYATIEHASKAEFEAFRRSGPANLLPPHQTDWMIGPTDPVYRKVDDVPDSVRRDPASGWWKTNGRACFGVIRTRLSEDQRAIVRAAWPKDHPDYWTDGDLDRHLPSQILESHRRFYENGIKVTRFRPAGTGQKLPEVFPMVQSFGLAHLTPATPLVDERDILIGDGASNLGQVFCDDMDTAITEAVIPRPLKRGCVVSVGGTHLPLHIPDECENLEIMPFFYRDQYVIATIPSFRS